MSGGRGPLGQADVPDARAVLPHAEWKLLRVLEKGHRERKEFRNELLQREDLIMVSMRRSGAGINGHVSAGRGREKGRNALLRVLPPRLEIGGPSEHSVPRLPNVDEEAVGRVEAPALEAQEISGSRADQPARSGATTQDSAGAELS